MIFCCIIFLYSDICNEFIINKLLLLSQIPLSFFYFTCENLRSNYSNCMIYLNIIEFFNKEVNLRNSEI